MNINDFINVLEANKNILNQFIEKMTEKEINYRIKNYWTIYEHLEHLAFSQKVLLNRIKQFIEEENPIIKPSGPKTMEINENCSVNNLLEIYCKLRNEQINILKNIDVKIFNKVAIHEEYKKYTLEILIRHSMLHDSFHMYRMEELWIKKDDLIYELESI